MNNKPYKLYTDKSQDFQCQLYLEGIPMENTRARMVIESKDASISFGGTINRQGKCIIPINGLGNKLGEASGGLMRLEVFAGDIFFQPWKSQFMIEGRKFDSSINTTGITESTENTVRIEVEINNLKQDVIEISEKVDYLSKNKDEKYTDSIKKWDTNPLNEVKIKEAKKIDENKIKHLNGLVEKDYKNINENITPQQKEENYVDIVDKWGAINDEDFEI